MNDCHHGAASGSLENPRIVPSRTNSVRMEIQICVGRFNFGGKLVRHRHDGGYVVKKMLTGVAFRQVLASSCRKWRQTLLLKEYV